MTEVAQFCDAATLSEILKKILELSSKLTKINGPKWQKSFTRFDSAAKSKEYVGYAGGNDSMHTTNSQYFNRSCKGALFDGPCLVLKSVCWMNTWGQVEGIPVPQRDCSISVFIYHAYQFNFAMNNHVNVYMSTVPDKAREPVW